MEGRDCLSDVEPAWGPEHEPVQAAPEWGRCVRWAGDHAVRNPAESKRPGERSDLGAGLAGWEPRAELNDIKTEDQTEESVQGWGLCAEVVVGCRWAYSMAEEDEQILNDERMTEQHISLAVVLEGLHSAQGTEDLWVVQEAEGDPHSAPTYGHHSAAQNT